jgi:hypothetical protein
MAFSLALYEDAGLTTLKTGNIVATQAADGSTGPLIFSYFLGSPVANRKFEVAANPGVLNVILSITDVSPGSGHEATEVKLAYGVVGNLAAAVAGADLILGTPLLSGVVNAIPIFIEIDDATMTVGTSTELAIETQVLIESDV